MPVKEVGDPTLTFANDSVVGLANICTQVVELMKVVPVPVTVTPNEVPLSPLLGLKEIDCAVDLLVQNNRIQKANEKTLQE